MIDSEYKHGFDRRTVVSHPSSQPLIPEPRRRPDGKGRPWRDSREVMNSILWILRTGAPWHDMPERYPLSTIPDLSSEVPAMGSLWRL